MTTIEFDRLTGGFTEQSRGWTVSVLLHGVAIAGTVLLMARVDYNKSLSNLVRQKATTLDRYHLEVS